MPRAQLFILAVFTRAPMNLGTAFLTFLAMMSIASAQGAPPQTGLSDFIQPPKTKEEPQLPYHLKNQTPFTRWSVSEGKSKFDDSSTVIVSQSSMGLIKSRFKSGFGQINIRCMEGSTSVYFTFADLFMSSHARWGDITIRVDKRAARVVRTNSSTDHRALGLWTGASSIPFLKTLLAGTRLFVRATPFNESPVELEFDLQGLSEAMTPLRRACKW